MIDGRLRQIDERYRPAPAVRGGAFHAGPGDLVKDEIDAKIKLVPADPQLKTVSLKTSDVKVHI